MFELHGMASQPTSEEHVYPVEFYTISFALITILRWHMLPAQKETMYHTRVYVPGSHWTWSIFKSSMCDLVYLHRFLQEYLVVFKILTLAEVEAYST
jgi:hypothetical protein